MGEGEAKLLSVPKGFADSLGCRSSSSAEMLQCLRQMPKEEQILNIKMVCLPLRGRWQAMGQRGLSSSCGSRETVISLG